MARLVLSVVCWTTVINAIQAEDIATTWVAGRADDAGKSCEDVCKDLRWGCKETADWPDTKQKMQDIASAWPHGTGCTIFCKRKDFDLPAIRYKGEKLACGNGEETTQDIQCIFGSLHTPQTEYTSRCLRKVPGRVAICPCEHRDHLATASKATTTTTGSSAAKQQGPKTSSTEVISNTSTPFRRVTTKKSGDSQSTLTISGNLVTFVVVMAGAAAFLFVMIILIAGCYCYCRNRNLARDRAQQSTQSQRSNHSRRGRRQSRNSRRNSRNSSRRNSRRNSRSSSRRNSRNSSRGRRSNSSSRKGSSSSSGRSSSRGHRGNLRSSRSDLPSSSVTVHTVVHMADNAYSDSGFNTPGAGPYNVTSDIYGTRDETELCTLAEMLTENYNTTY